MTLPLTWVLTTSFTKVVSSTLRQDIESTQNLVKIKSIPLVNVIPDTILPRPRTVLSEMGTHNAIHKSDMSEWQYYLFFFLFTISKELFTISVVYDRDLQS